MGFPDVLILESRLSAASARVKMFGPWPLAPVSSLSWDLGVPQALLYIALGFSSYKTTPKEYTSEAGEEDLREVLTRRGLEREENVCLRVFFFSLTVKRLQIVSARRTRQWRTVSPSLSGSEKSSNVLYLGAEASLSYA
jgi:hypothetical protein